MIVNTGKIQKGDYVKHNPSGFCGDVVTIYDNGEVFVQWEKKDLLPCKLPMIEFQKVAKVLTGAQAVYPVEAEMIEVPNKKCSVCNNDYKETWIAGDAYYDCLKCGKTKEDIDKRFDGYSADQATQVDVSKNFFDPNWMYGQDDDEPEAD